MIFKLKTQNSISLKLLIIFFSFPLLFRSQNTIPTTTVSGCLHVDSSMVTSGNLDVAGSGRIDSSLVVGDTMKAQDIVVSGNAKIAGNINVGGGMYFKNGTGISVTTGSALTSEIYNYGKTAIGTSPPINTCLNPNPPWQIHQFGGGFQVYDNGPTGYTGGNILSIQSWFNGSSIDVAGGGGLLMNYFCGKDIVMCTGTNGGNVFVGDKFRPSKNVQIGPHWQTLDPNVALDVYLSGTTSGLKLWSGANPNVKLIHDNYEQFMVMGNGKTSIGVNATPGAAPYKTLTVNGDASFANYGNSTDGLNAFEIVGNNQKPKRRGISVDNDPQGHVNFFIHSDQQNSSFKFKNGANNFDLMTLDINGKLSLLAYSTIAFQIGDPIADQVTFTIKNNGQTFIGNKKVQISNAHATASLQVSGKIACQELVVLDPVKWADFVFEKNYKLTPLKEVEKYYLANKHLKDVPSAKEVRENGISTGEMFSVFLQKIEDLTLYTVAQDKRIEKLEKEKEEMKVQLKSLQKN
jgi:hypothetical protein